MDYLVHSRCCLFDLRANDTKVLGKSLALAPRLVSGKVFEHGDIHEFLSVHPSAEPIANPTGYLAFLPNQM